MLAKVCKLLAGMTILCLLLGPALVVAAPSGSGPADPMTPSGEWTPLTKGEVHWYAFDYQRRQEMQEVVDSEDEDEVEPVWVSTNVQILLDSEPDDGIAFSVWTPENIRDWTLGEDPNPIGRGGADEYAPGDLCWCGNFQEAGTYYVAVEHTGQGPDTAYYSLEIRGSDVSFSAPTAPVEGPVEPESMDEGTDMAVEPVDVDGGTGPDNALPFSEGWVSISDGQATWYTFDYQGHHEFEEDEDGEEVATWIATPVQIWLDSEPDEAASFAIWSEELVQLWAKGEEVDPLGRGTENENEAGDLFWAGGLGGPGTYYVVVEGAAPGSYQLSISGEVLR